MFLELSSELHNFAFGGKLDGTFCCSMLASFLKTHALVLPNHIWLKVHVQHRVRSSFLSHHYNDYHQIHFAKQMK